MDTYPVFPSEIMMLIADHLEDSRPVYLSSKTLYVGSPDRIYWESRGNGRIRTHPIKIPTSLPLSSFAKEGNLSMVRHLHLQGADITENDNEALLDACKYGFLGIVMYIHSTGVDIKTQNSLAFTRACESGNLELVKYLHRAGLNIKSYGVYTVGCACRSNNPKVVEYLHDNGLYLDGIVNHMLLFDFSDGVYRPILKCLYKHSTNNQGTYILIAASNGDIELLMYFLYLTTLTGDFLAQTLKSAMHVAASKGHLDIVKYLYWAGVPIERKYNTAIRAACAHGHVKIVKYLHENGADIKDDSDDLIQVAINNRHFGVVAYIHDVRAKTAMRQCSGPTWFKARHMK